MKSLDLSCPREDNWFFTVHMDRGQQICVLVLSLVDEDEDPKPGGHARKILLHGMVEPIL